MRTVLLSSFISFREFTISVYHNHQSSAFASIYWFPCLLSLSYQLRASEDSQCRLPIPAKQHLTGKTRDSTVLTKKPEDERSHYRKWQSKPVREDIKISISHPIPCTIGILCWSNFRLCACRLCNIGGPLNNRLMWHADRVRAGKQKYFVRKCSGCTWVFSDPLNVSD